MHRKLPQSIVRQVLPNNESYESKTGSKPHPSNRTLGSTDMSFLLQFGVVFRVLRCRHRFFLAVTFPRSTLQRQLRPLGTCPRELSPRFESLVLVGGHVPIASQIKEMGPHRRCVLCSTIRIVRLTFVGVTFLPQGLGEWPAQVDCVRRR